MNKRFGYIISLAAALVVFSACSSSNNSSESTSSTTSEEKVLKVGSTGQSYPNGYKENDKLVGFDVEVLETIAKDLGYKVEWTTTDFSGLMAQLESGKLDTVANAVAMTDERKETYNFADPYSYYGAQIVTSTKNTDINSLDDLKGKTVAGVLGSNNLKNLQAYDKNGDITIRTYETRDGALQDAVNNRVDGYINSRPILAAEIKKSNLALKYVGDPIAYESVSFPFAKTEAGSKLAKEFSTEIKKLRESGKLKELSEKYFGEDITEETK
ncbi:amino acid ABC transporter substrate-binding protein [Enterococcus italicus]|uniref:amino acid ABC transporter substrate-binding protein n=1 Tax=Enterococcus italicus TaxID=246144 RepID=UPI0020744D34|nr:amino acid ABC transporter substrate-binding protein [Enterococcus italicus]MCM6932065.1 amino acid ABC transporter substrate-binding protein [Enterococcus italicus]